MSKDKELLMWKLLASGAALFYLYKVTKANGGSLKNNPMGVSVQSENIVRLASQFVPKEFRPHAQRLGNHLLDKVLDT